MIRQAKSDDAKALAIIYNHYIANTVITFEVEPISSLEMARRIAAIQSQKLPWLVAEDNQQIVGYAYATPWRSRRAYQFSVEISAYLSPVAINQGWGSQLYQVLFEELKEQPIHAVIGGISLPNDASVALHEKFSMNKVAHFGEVGYKFNQWVDVGYWQRVLNGGKSPNQ